MTNSQNNSTYMYITNHELFHNMDIGYIAFLSSFSNKSQGTSANCNYITFSANCNYVAITI